MKIEREVTEFLLPGLVCPCCGTVTFPEPPPGTHAGAVTYGPVLNAAAVLLSAYGNVPAERSAHLIGMLLGTEVSAGWVDKAAARVNARLKATGFDDAMIAALAGARRAGGGRDPGERAGQDPAAGPGRGDGPGGDQDWDTGSHPGYALACWLQEYKEQVFLFTRDFNVGWTNNVSERREGSQTSSGSLGILALPAYPRPLVPAPELPGLRRRPRRRATLRPDDRGVTRPAIMP